jgi:Protein of unknown function (DUF3253)
MPRSKIHPGPKIQPRPCAVCGRDIEEGKKSERDRERDRKRDWDQQREQVRYCSDGCRSAKLTDLDVLLEATILELLELRGPGKTICPSEAARRVLPDDWGRLMERTRAAARRLVARDQIAIMQGGVVVDASQAMGAIRLKKI